MSLLLLSRYNDVSLYTGVFMTCDSYSYSLLVYLHHLDRLHVQLQVSLVLPNAKKIFIKLTTTLKSNFFPEILSYEMKNIPLHGQRERERERE